jgi:hypothetical protein
LVSLKSKLGKGDGCKSTDRLGEFDGNGGLKEVTMETGASGQGEDGFFSGAELKGLGGGSGDGFMEREEGIMGGDQGRHGIGGSSSEAASLGQISHDDDGKRGHNPDDDQQFEEGGPSIFEVVNHGRNLTGFMIS